MTEDLPHDDTAATEIDGVFDDDDEASDFEQNPTLFIMTGVATSLDEIVLEDCLTKVLSSYDISNDESGDEEESQDNFLPSIMVTLLETDYNDEKGTILFCVDRSLVLLGSDDNEETETATAKANEDVMIRIREYIGSEQAKTSDPVWATSNATIEIVEEEQVAKMTEEEAYESWLKHNEAEGGDNTNVVPDYEGKKEAEE